jgi:small subunit ribosomal protein S17
MTVKNIGVPNVVPPPEECSDPHCPFHGQLRVRGQVFTGTVDSTKMLIHHTATIRRDYNFYVPKYQRYERRNAKTTVHVPPCIPIKTGDFVRVGECRKLSKTKAYVVIEVIKAAEEQQ